MNFCCNFCKVCNNFLLKFSARKTYSRTTRANLSKSTDSKTPEKVAETIPIQTIDLETNTPVIVNGLNYATPIQASDITNLQTFNNAGYVNMIITDPGTGQISAPITAQIAPTSVISTSTSSGNVLTSVAIQNQTLNASGPTVATIGVSQPASGHIPARAVINTSITQVQQGAPAQLLAAQQMTPVSADGDLVNNPGGKKTRRTTSTSVSKPSLRSNSGTGKF